MTDLNKSIIYEIYPTSFYDSDGDGIGDLKGIAEKLDYVKELGADIVWLNPIYKSPFKDGGYDVQDYYAVDEKFGTFEDFRALIKKAHALGIKVLLDLVIGHTSDKHPWFKASKREKKNKYSDYYIWTSNIFTGGENTVKGLAKRNGNYVVNYYSFQPALNYGYSIEKRDTSDPWASEEWKTDYKDERLQPLKEELLKMMLFWLENGADGFRVDLAPNMIKGKLDLNAMKWFWGYFIGESKKKYPGAIFLAEWGEPEKSLKCGFDIDYFSHCSKGYNELFRADPGSNLLSAFENGHSYFSESGKGDKESFLSYAESLSTNGDNGYYCVPSGYHDMIRLSFNRDEDAMKCVFAFLLTYKNLPMIYYGDEIGVRHNFKVNKDGGYIRTGARTPMQWTNGKNRGFSKNDKIYLPAGCEEEISVESQEKRADSLLNTVKMLVRLRKTLPALAYDAETKTEKSAYPFVYERKKDGQKLLVAINPAATEFTLDRKIKKVIFANNAEYCGKIVLKAKSFLIAEE